MEKRIKNTFLIFIINFSISSHAIAKDETKKAPLIVGVSAVCPYACLNDEGKWHGYIVEILESISKIQKVDIQIRDIPNSRLLQSLRLKQIDSAILPLFSFRYESDIIASQATLGFSLAGLATHKDDAFHFTDISELKMATVVFADLGEETSKIISDIEIQAEKSKVSILTGTDSIKRLLKLIKIKRARFGIGEYNLLKAESKDFPDVRVQPTSIAGFSSIHLASLNSRKDLQEFDKVLSRWIVKERKKGTLKSIFKKYNLEDWDAFTSRP